MLNSLIVIWSFLIPCLQIIFLFQKRPEFGDVIHLVENCFEPGTLVQANGGSVKEDSPPPVLTPVEEYSSDERESEDDLPLAGHVSALRSRWESEASRNR